jgi:hypothetical protein
MDITTKDKIIKLKKIKKINKINKINNNLITHINNSSDTNLDIIDNLNTLTDLNVFNNRINKKINKIKQFKQINKITRKSVENIKNNPIVYTYVMTDILPTSIDQDQWPNILQLATELNLIYLETVAKIELKILPEYTDILDENDNDISDIKLENLPTDLTIKLPDDSNAELRVNRHISQSTSEYIRLILAGNSNQNSIELYDTTIGEITSVWEYMCRKTTIDEELLDRFCIK